MGRVRSIAEWEMDEQRNRTDPALRLRDAYIPEHFHGKTWDDYDDDVLSQEDEPVKDVLKFWADHWTPQTHDGLVLLGPPGVGKTFGAILTAMQVIQAGGWVKYITEDQLAIRRGNAIGLEREADRTGDWGEANAAKYRMLFIETECDLLVLDDVGKAFRSTTDWANVRLDSLLRRRVEAGKATIVTSNVILSGWKTFDGSLASFLTEVGEIVSIPDLVDKRPPLTPTARLRRSQSVSEFPVEEEPRRRARR